MPKEPEFETSQHVRSVRVKSTVELEEKMTAKILKFKARPLNKKVEEEKTLNLLRRTLVPYARPMPNFEHPFCFQK
ncbi:hypothetical protein CerSpe_114430 [Prunus speciosa]